mgnify:CR=1 FL=1
MAEKKSGKKWIQKAIKKPGSLRATAKEHGAIAKDGDIKKSFIDKAAKGKFGKKTEKRAELAKTLSKMRKKK